MMLPDLDGTHIDPKITLTPAAIDQAVRLSLDSPECCGLPLRIYIEGKGCDGFYYGVAFAPAEPDDVVFNQGDLKLVIDKQSLIYMEGAVITWVDDDRGQGFLVDNPNHRRFRGKFYKKKSWQDKLTSSSR